MLLGDADRPCFGPAEIAVMRRALELAELSLQSAPAMSRRAQIERRQRLAKYIVEFAAQGDLDPLVLSAKALGCVGSGLMLRPLPLRPQRPLRARAAQPQRLAETALHSA